MYGNKKLTHFILLYLHRIKTSMEIQILDKTFIPYISEVEIQQALQRMASEMMKDFSEEIPVFIGVLNGSFMVMSDLMKYYTQPCELSFVKMASYEGLSTTHQVKQLIGLDIDLSGRHVILVEDIVDTGNTLEVLLELINAQNCKNIHVATLFFKPDAYTKSFALNYVGKEIPDKFIVGFGLDYNKQGRNLNAVYQIK